MFYEHITCVGAMRNFVFLSLVLFFLAVVDLIKSVSDKQDGKNKQALTPAYFSAVSIKAASYVYDKDIFKFSITIMYFALLFVQFILNCIAESRSRRGYYEMGKEPCPEIKASFLSRLTFWWINGLVIRGYKKDLEEEDIWALNPRDNSDTVVPEFEEAWSKEVRKHKQIA
ncbi:hypothetical protein KUTeg_006520 [Tegillarca granosa]|uniref:Uncharacterized protein n=1 Tax=Tegillarca granosa TaxID=220873 RepID=A0ABQ9FGQ2_TEGGR|nr:hypothetical protein KUTeg_006520 [Tegillarca granosa]